MKHILFRAGLSALSASGIARAASPWTQGLGAILMFHRVRPYEAKAFDPFRMLEITPAFLDAVLSRLGQQGYEIIPIGSLADRIRHPRPDRPFAVLTFDDGYRDTAEHALPVLRKHQAPFTVFAATGFADGTAPLWWLDLAEAVERGATLGFEGGPARLATAEQKLREFNGLFGELRERPGMLGDIANLAAKADIDTLARARELCLDWDGLRALAADPLCTLGAHTLTHPLLGTQDDATARREMTGSKGILEEKLGLAVRHIAYPVGDPAAAGVREFALAREIGFETGLTTRPGVIFPGHADHLHALPRLSVNGLYQSIADFDVLLSGAAFWLFNRGRKLNVT
ncbi:MAG: polysaccharide deacetylase family protein [Methylocystis sp.]|nr:polysaccharide deacetylase family protein [Methylocystis sp.]MCA3585338.1 polysaccharide deacetylase family protein [Methylocystis sp.]MCA3589603.1 polysaccharide deacetylase family protein [Methylocystis sp.]MCA3591545.1 polysaccharide deacetylase family protein [Methylocystis sp.]